MMQHRQYQADAVAECESLLAEKSGPVLLVNPTGTGKTHCAALLIANRLTAYPHQRPIFVAPRREIVYQTERSLRGLRMDPGLIMAGHDYWAKKEVQVASVDTLRSWIRSGRVVLEAGSFMVQDEAHRAGGKTYQWLIDAYREADGDVLGLTATPIRSDGVGLGRFFQHMVVGLTMVQAILQGYLVKPEYRVAYVPDLDGVSVRGGDYASKELEAVLNRQQLVGDIVSNWLKHGQNRPTLAFASGVKHSMAIAEEFQKVGVRAAHIDGDTDKDIRDQAVADIQRGKLDLITSCGVFTEGTDIPNIGCIIDAGPTKSLGRHIQKLGRGLRTYFDGLPHEDSVEGRLHGIATSSKPNCIILDHAGNFYRNGRVDRNIEWLLTDGKEVVEKDAQRREKAKVSFTCDDCGRVFGGQLYCPSCGTKIVIRGKMADYVEADLVSLTAAQFKNIETTLTAVDQRNFYLEALHWARQTAPKKRVGDPDRPRRKDQFAAILFKEKFGDWPPWDWRNLTPIKPSRETLNYIRYNNMKFVYGAKSREAKEAAKETA